MNVLIRTVGVLAVMAATSTPWAAHVSLGRDIIDVFPVQSWASISHVAPAPQQETASESDLASIQPVEAAPAQPSNPYELLGEWRDSRTQIFVVGAFGRDETFIVCGKPCTIDGAVRPGQTLAGGYRVKKISPAGLQIVAQDGVVYELPASGLGQ